MSQEPNPHDPILAMSATVLAAYVGHHDVAQGDLPALARTIYQSLANASDEEAVTVGKGPAVPIEKSITDSHLICLEDGKRFQSLKRHLRVAFGLTPDAYREKWGLPDDYPMVSPAYARRRSDLAKQSGLGKSV
ncbi:MucR family transcriptional regulator [Algimonas arctica]|uniref:MucR family transcriptional regulator n=1 Tax=Algimonas arctica TaxID=1479486 RepID=A0A8J3G2X4_9PROT|nr:MucR family transcriptional regulator [Algimonas arctica]GHA99088.1 MucR family transcriptional regulator [Algimonas arctica]